MEERPAGGATGAESPATAEPPSSRRRAGGMKRKVNALSTSGSSSTPSKRLTRDKAAIVHAPIHNGPLTRARQGPNSFAGATASGHFGFEEKAAATSLQEVAKAMEEEKVTRLEELEATMEADFESLRSRDPNVHVVPSHCGWFSWTKVHPLEERVMPSFFNGKSQTRTSDVYMKIRNWIIKKFHSNPNENIELKDLSELEVGDADARQEVLEFLDYWGLINFHPFPEIDSAANVDEAETAKKDLLLENLFHFESVQPYQSATPKPNITTPAVPSGLFPDSAIAEDLLRPEGPIVDYSRSSLSSTAASARPTQSNEVSELRVIVDTLRDQIVNQRMEHMEEIAKMREQMSEKMREELEQVSKIRESMEQMKQAAKRREEMELLAKMRAEVEQMTKMREYMEQMAQLRQEMELLKRGANSSEHPRSPRH